MTLTFSTHTPHGWSRAQAIDALLQASEAWPDYTFRVIRRSAQRVQIFTLDARRQPIGWLGAA